MRIVLALSLMLPTAAMSLSPEEIFAKVSPSIVVIRVSYASTEDSGSGSGVVISPGNVVTNCHVVDEAAKIVVHRDGKKSAAKVRFADKDRDLCLLQASRAAPFNRPITSLVAPEDLRVGQRVYAIGAPLELDLTMSQGIISSIRQLDDGTKLVQTDAAISPGSSGGGLFDEGGRLVGITTFYFKGGQNLNFAIPSNWILELLGRQGDASDAERAAAERREQDQRQREAALRAEQERRERALREERVRLDEERRKLEEERGRLARAAPQPIERPPSASEPMRLAGDDSQPREASTMSEAEAIAASLQVNFKYPDPSARILNAKYRVRVFRAGYLERVDLIQGSTDVEFDRMALELIRQSAPFNAIDIFRQYDFEVVIGWYWDHPVFSVVGIGDAPASRSAGADPRPVRPVPARPAPMGAPITAPIDRGTLERYSLLVSREIGKDQIYPQRAKTLGWQGTTQLLIRVGADARVKNVSIVQSSGYGVLDEEALSKVRRVKQLPLPPEAFRDREFTVTVPITFYLY